MLGLGIKEGSNEWKYRHHYWSGCIKAEKMRNAMDYIWKNIKGRLGKDTMREFKYCRGNSGRMKRRHESACFGAAQTLRKVFLR